MKNPKNLVLPLLILVLGLLSIGAITSVVPASGSTIDITDGVNITVTIPVTDVPLECNFSTSMQTASLGTSYNDTANDTQISKSWATSTYNFRKDQTLSVQCLMWGSASNTSTQFVATYNITGLAFKDFVGKDIGNVFTDNLGHIGVAMIPYWSFVVLFLVMMVITAIVVYMKKKAK